jgi:uncharacterized membrane protein
MNNEPNYEKALREERQRSERTGVWLTAWVIIVIVLLICVLHLWLGWWPWWSSNEPQ